MKLGIISDCIHYNTGDGKVGTENHILLRQLEVLSSYFSETLICCPFAPTRHNTVYTSYTKANIRFIALPDVGGNTIKEKAKLLTALPAWFKTYRQVHKFSDIVYQRFPNNLNIPGFFYFYLKQKKVFGTYTGTWAGYAAEPATYRFQRWLLKKHFKGPVWVYADKPTKSNRVLSGISPSYNDAEWEEETEQVKQRIEAINRDGIGFYRFITVGTLIDYKNQLGILKACLILKAQDFSFKLTIVGDGPMRNELDEFINENNLEAHVTLAGKKNHVELRALYRQHDFVVQAPLAEGFGKVPIEGFFHGVIPVINNIGVAKQMIGDEERGFLFDAADPQQLATTLLNLPSKTDRLTQMIAGGRAYAKSQTLEAWADEYYSTIKKYFANA
jgi:glycosyltransferase involved in cell wall biosynthesis